MQELNLEEYEGRVILRQIRMEDFDRIVVMQAACFEGMQTWQREQIESQLQIFPEGQLCIEYDGLIVASASSLIVDFDHYHQWHNWREIADNGYIRNHDPEGDTLYGIEMMVDPKYRGMKLSRRLYEARKEMVRRRNLPRIIIAGRIPGYGQHANRLTPREYVEQVMRKDLFDPVLTAQVANGFVLRQLIPDYMPGDTDSRGYATFLEWTNLDFREGKKRRFAAVSLARICVVQYEMRPVKDYDDFARQCAFFVDVASDYKSDFVLFPELFTTQLLSVIDAKRPGEAARELARYTPQYLDLFHDMSVKYNVNIIAGSQFTIENDRLYNVSYLFRRNGTIAKQYKIHVTPSERRWWGVEPGNKVEVFDTDRGKISIQICYDIEFPEIGRVAAQKGAKIFFVPFNTDERYSYLRVRSCAQARAVENGVYVAIAGVTGNLPFVDNADIHYAQSGIYTPADIPFARDAIASECTENIETMIIHDVDTEVLRRNRLSGTVRTWNDRRTDLYHVHYEDPDDGPMSI
jgi:predicted amidohydrolase/GNAT superfamily N-acetyltransferase